MQLEKALTHASRREVRVRVTVLVLWSLYLILPFVGFGLANGGHMKNLFWYPPLMYLLLIVAIVETVSYFVRFLPARLRAGVALNRDILHDLDRRIADLTSRIDQATKTNEPKP